MCICCHALDARTMLQCNKQFRTSAERPVDGSKGQLCLLDPAFCLGFGSMIFVFPQLKRNVSRGEPSSGLLIAFTMGAICSMKFCTWEVNPLPIAAHSYTIEFYNSCPCAKTYLPSHPGFFFYPCVFIQAIFFYFPVSDAQGHSIIIFLILLARSLQANFMSGLMSLVPHLPW